MFNEKGEIKMNLSDETYMKHHVTQLDDLGAEERELWTIGQNNWCMKHHGMSYDEYITNEGDLVLVTTYSDDGILMEESFIISD